MNQRATDGDGATIAKLLLDPPSQGDRPAVLLVTHDDNLAQQLDRVVRMRDGQLIADGA